MRSMMALYADHFMRSILSSARRLAIYLALYKAQLSPGRIKLLFSHCFSSLNGSKCSSVMRRYVVYVKVLLQASRTVRLYFEKHSHVDTHWYLDLNVWTKLSGCRRYPSMRLTRRLLFAGLTKMKNSFVNASRTHSVSSQILCFRAYRAHLRVFLVVPYGFWMETIL